MEEEKEKINNSFHNSIGLELGRAQIAPIPELYCMK